MFNSLMKLLWVMHPNNKRSDTMLTFVSMTVFVCCVKFLFEGLSFTLGEFTFTFSQSDSLTYAAMLAPVLGAHGYIKVQPFKSKEFSEKGSEKVDNPDGAKL